MNQIQDKVAVVTGGTRGIGVAIARGLLEKGARVLICSRNSEQVAAATRELQAEFDGRAWGAGCDVSDYRSVQALFSEADRLFGGLDILINNAGIGSFSRVAEMTVEEWSATLDTNLSGVFYCCREALPLLKKRGGGFIINVGSLAGKHPRAGAAAYCASKFGLIGFTESLMEEVRYDHIRVSCVMPGSVNTGFAARGEQDPEKTWKLLPEDVAAVVVDLLEMDARALPSRVELRPSEPRK
jgi:NAD(P)-dependent dehydrogenase (short-subunit alcohol dehydrogenase family)